MFKFSASINQRGVISLPLLLIAVGVIAFLGLSYYAPFKDKLLTSLYQKPDSKAAQMEIKKKFADDTILVKFKDSVSETDQEDIIRSQGASKKDEIKQIKVKVLQVPQGQVEEKIKALNGNPNIEFAEPDFIAEASEVPSDPRYGEQWGFNKIFVPEAFDLTKGSGSVSVAVNDTGIDSNHQDLTGKVVKKINFSTSATVEDSYGHGTHVAGTVGANTNNGLGVAGVCAQCALFNVKVLGDDKTGKYSWLTNGIIWSADNGAKVISMSMGGTSDSSTLKSAVDYAWNKGVVLVAAAGNSGLSDPFYPAYFSNVIAVGATDGADNKATFSSFGNWVDVAAPGVSILSTRNGNYSYSNGTSMAAPHVSGLAGLLFSIHPDWKNIQVREAIEKSADPVAGTGTYWTYGRINAVNALKYVSIVPSPTSALTPKATLAPKQRGKSNK